MRIEEVSELMDFIERVSPQKFDEEALDAWALLIGDLDYRLTKQALVTILRRQVFAAPAEIRTEVERVGRLQGAKGVLPAPSNPDDPPRYRGELQQMLTELVRGNPRFDDVRAITASNWRASTPEESAALRESLGLDPEFARKRQAALGVACRRCKELPGRQCKVPGTRHVLEKSPAHQERLVDVGEAVAHRPATQEEFAALLASQGHLDGQGE